MQETIQCKAVPSCVWEMWEKAHMSHSQKGIEAGQKGKSRFKYKILEVVPGESYSIVWKTMFVRLVFTHMVKPTSLGSEISYKVQIKGPFAWPIRYFLQNKIKKNISVVLKSLVYQLDN
jgi:hypothetical protein